MKLEQSFTVAAPVDRVWAALIDVQRIAPCLPGAEITEAADDGTYRGNFQVRLGPTTAAYRGTLKMVSLDEAARVATMSASGQDKRGQGSANATIVSRMTEEGGSTRVDVETDFTITGRLARFGRSGMIQDISKRLLRDFSDCLQEEILSSEPVAAAGAQPPAAAGEPAPAAPAAPGSPAPAPAAAASGAATPAAPTPAPPPARREAKPVQGLSLFFSILWERIKRLFGRGAR